MKIDRFKAYLKDPALEGLNKEHFDRPDIGRMFDVEIINFEERTVAIRTPSLLVFDFKDIELYLLLDV